MIKFIVFQIIYFSLVAAIFFFDNNLNFHSFHSLIHFVFSCTVESIWPKSKRRNSLDDFEDDPPCKISRAEKEAWFIRLASESPDRSYYDSEDSTYDSFNAHETGTQVDI